VGAGLTRPQNETAPSLGLIGDVGGTNCRFALVTLGETEMSTPVKYPCADYPDILAAISDYLSREAGRRKIEWAVIAVAGPVVHNVVMMTNLSWRIAGDEIAAQFGLREAHIVNDFTAFARATPMVEAQNLISLGGAPYTDPGVRTVAVVGAGTGLGVGGLVSGDRGVYALTTEGGHSTYAPVTEFDFKVLAALRTKFDRVSNERLLSGEGLFNIYEALAKVDGAKAEDLAPKEITRRAIEKSDPRCVTAVQYFCRVLGAFSGDVVLTQGALAGLYVSGGVIQAMVDIFDRAAFREGFEDKGRFRGYMEKIPAWIVVHPFAGLLGSAALAGDMIPRQSSSLAAKA